MRETDDAGNLNGRRVLVVTAGLDVGGDIVAGLVERGAQVALLSDNGELLAAVPQAVATVATTFASRAAVETAVDAALARLGGIDIAVLSALPAALVQGRALTALSEAEWLSGPRGAIRTVLYCLQALGRHLQAQGGAVVLLGPSLALAGCRELVALTTLLEGQRGLMKSVARQWGDKGVTLNWLACASRTLAPVFAAAPLAAKADAVPVALGRGLDTRREIVPVIGFLGSAAGRAMTGATLTVDGGEWMLP